MHLTSIGKVEFFFFGTFLLAVFVGVGRLGSFSVVKKPPNRLFAFCAFSGFGGETLTNCCLGLFVVVAVFAMVCLGLVFFFIVEAGDFFAFCGSALALTTALLLVLPKSNKLNVGLLTAFSGFGGETLTGCLGLFVVVAVFAMVFLGLVFFIVEAGDFFAFCGSTLALTTALLLVLTRSNKLNVGLLTAFSGFGGETLTGCFEDGWFASAVGRDLPPPNRLNVGLELVLGTLRFFSDDLVFFGSFFLGWLAALISAS